MQVVIRDIWDYTGSHWIVVPTNLDGPMGRGVAQQAKERYPELESAWKRECRKAPGIAFYSWCHCILFPVKYHWRDKADLKLIELGLKALSGWAKPTALPQIGCGFGELNWNIEIEPLVQKYLEGKENFLLVLPPDSVKQKYPKAFQAGARQDRRFSS